MRAFAPLAALVLLAGCFGGDDGTSPTPTTPATSTPEPTPSATPEPTTPTPTAEPTPTPTTGEPTPEPPLPPLVVANQTFDFSRDGDPTGQAPRERPTRAVPEGYATVTVNVTIERAQVAPTGLPVSGTVNQPTVRVLDAEGTEVLVVRQEGAQESVSVAAVPGEWMVRYEGAGTLRALVLITAFP